jgi:peptidoglycan/xylan/chitin deacetylase (PgdA/CDA1 family)
MIISVDITATSEQLNNVLFGKYLMLHTHRLLGLLAEHRIKATFFVQTEVAQWYPLLIQAIYEQGHEVAALSTSQRHTDVAGEIGFRAEIRRCIRLLQTLVNHPILGFKSTAGLAPNTINWYGKALRDVGIRYDASQPNQTQWVKYSTLNQLEATLAEYQVTYYPTLIPVRKSTYVQGLSGKQLTWLPEKLLHKVLSQPHSLQMHKAISLNVQDLINRTQHPLWSTSPTLNKVKQFAPTARLERRLSGVLSRYNAKSFQAQYFPDLYNETQRVASLVKTA